MLSSRQNLSAVDHIKQRNRLWITVVSFTFHVLNIDSTYFFIHLLYSEHETKLPQVELVLLKCHRHHSEEGVFLSLELLGSHDKEAYHH